MNNLTQEKTPFEEAGYTKDTKFRMKKDVNNLTKGTIVWLYWDDGSICPEFTDGCCTSFVYLPSLHVNGFIEVVEELITTEESYPNIQVKLSAVDKTPTYRVHFNELYHRDLSKAEAEEVYSLLGVVLNKN